MKAKITMTLLCIISWSLFSAQRIKQVKKIEFDYKTKSFRGNEIYRNLKVNDWVSISIINLPNDRDVSSTILFTNRNLESMDNFQNYIAFSKDNASGNINNPVDQNQNPLNEIEEQEKNTAKNEAKQERLDESFPEKQKAIQSVKTTQSSKEFDAQIKMIFKDESSTVKEEVDAILKKEYKINEKNALEALNIGNVENFVKKYIEKNPKGDLISEANKAKVDYQWQKELIGYLKDNMQSKIKARDSIINKMYEENKDLNTNTYTHNLPIVKIQNFDSTEFNITIESKDKKTKDLITLPFRNNCGFKLDFSTGFIVSGLYDEKYVIREGTAVDNVQIKEEVSTKLNLGITLLAHAYFRSTNFFNPAITSGLSVNLGNQSLNYILGGSLLLGEDQRFIISSGVMMGKVKTLPNYYQTDENISVDILPLSSQPPLVEKLKTSWFLGITYNLGISGKSKTIQLN